MYMHSNETDIDITTRLILQRNDHISMYIYHVKGHAILLIWYD